MEKGRVLDWRRPSSGRGGLRGSSRRYGKGRKGGGGGGGQEQRLEASEPENDCEQVCRMES
jgi:hypothetical protein